MSEVKRYHFEAFIDNYYKHYQFILASDYDALAAEAQALREEVERSEQHRNDQADLIVSLRTEVAALKHSQQVLIGSRNAHRDERDAARKEVAALRARVAVVPDGYALVPVEPTREMFIAINKEDDKAYADGCHHGAQFEWLWAAAIEAAPRLNGLTVSEGLLRRISNLFPADMGDDGSGRAGWFPHVRETVAELRALLSEQE
ncbi:hypothetical protein AB7A55_004942 [Pseudomonas aeruginosa]